ncbi:sigma-54-dependent Fis family transcriptional regulator [Bacillus thermotolerans]|uniref:sigma-54-dependent Fis family transcriptional regulator n=1 Tax=Bacillus thermotolerans TaxID=1221996 RepID=UPI0005895F58|nr:sigma-54-dependent Fis family transcriptional regulator [Bacillus thermotolerans]KKB44047.1 Transcriptional activator of acetoin dehydrogenase operon AcoR [Bacillus thermotolerans]
MQSVCYLSTWKRFIHEGTLDASRLNKRIAESWNRCRHQKVNPYLQRGEQFLTGDRLQKQKQKNDVFLQAATPVLQRIEPMMKELEAVVLLIDPSGYVLSMTGNKRVVHEARRINFKEGVRWREEEVGTNAIGTALRTEEAIMVSGLEHYSLASHGWSCAAAPVHSPDGRLLGVIDVSCSVDRAHPFMFGMVASVAHEIESELAAQAYQKEMKLINKCESLLERGRLVAVCDDHYHIVAVSPALRDCFPDYKGKKKEELLREGFCLKGESAILSDDQQQVIGSCLHLEEKAVSDPCHRKAEPPFIFEGEQGTSLSFQQTLEDVQKVAPTEVSVCILGETGTGKEVIAQAIHANSARRNGPFIAINCGALPADLVESELFGYAEGAFTGAKRNGHQGKFEQANGGTIFLDEIGELSLDMQVKLLRVLQERKVTRVGGVKEIELDIRVVTATHRNLEQLVAEGTFRKDLYYRLHVYPICVPPLRERKEDIPHLVRHYARKHQWPVDVPDAYMERFCEYDWPGNIRELFNVLERLRIASPQLALKDLHVLDPLFGDHPLSDTEKKEEQKLPEMNIREKIQKDLMIEALRKTKGNVTQAAKLLEVPRSTFYKRLKRFGL